MATIEQSVEVDEQKLEQFVEQMKSKGKIEILV